MDKQDTQYLNDPRTEEIADYLDETPAQVVETAEVLAEEFGDTVSEELDEGVFEVELDAALSDE